MTLPDAPEPIVALVTAATETAQPISYPVYERHYPRWEDATIDSVAEADARVMAEVKTAFVRPAFPCEDGLMLGVGEDVMVVSIAPSVRARVGVKMGVKP